MIILISAPPLLTEFACACVCARPAHLLGYGKCVSRCGLYSSLAGFPCERSGAEEVEPPGFCNSDTSVRTAPHDHNAQS